VQTHRPFTHVEFAPQATPQAPQLALSVLVVTQAPLQQAVPMEHLWPQTPQLLFVVVLVQVPPQLAVPGGQVQVPELAEQTQPLGALTQSPLQHASPLQQDAFFVQVPPGGPHLLVGAEVAADASVA
jgi:hypothetical protein